MTTRRGKEVRGKAEVVQHRHHRRAVAFVEVAEQLHRLDLVPEVEVDRGLVQEHRRRVLRHGEGQQHQLALAE